MKARRSVNSRLFGRLRVFSSKIIPLTGMLFKPAFLNQVKTVSSRDIALLRLIKSALLVLSQSLGRKNGSG